MAHPHSAVTRFVLSVPSDASKQFVRVEDEINSLINLLYCIGNTYGNFIHEPGLKKMFVRFNWLVPLEMAIWHWREMSRQAGEHWEPK
jgi:hypothetical protein